jgi:hypothetical protein
MMQIINGVMSPATLGIDISKRDNAEAQREKEKVTIFTRNGIIDTETPILKDLCDNTSKIFTAFDFKYKTCLRKFQKKIDFDIKFIDN